MTATQAKKLVEVYIKDGFSFGQLCLNEILHGIKQNATQGEISFSYTNDNLSWNHLCFLKKSLEKRGFVVESTVASDGTIIVKW